MNRRAYHGPLATQAIRLLRQGPASCKAISEATGSDWCVVNRVLHILLRRGEIQKAGRPRHIVWSIA